MSGINRHRWVLVIAVTVLASACGPEGTDAAEATPTATRTAATAAASPTDTTAAPTAPSLRGYHGMVEAGDLGVLMFGGYFAEGPPGCCAPDAAWAYSTSDGWTDLGLTSDEVPDLDDAVYDTDSRMAVIYTVNGSFTYDPETDQVQPTPSRDPSGLFAARMAYDAGSDRIVLFGTTGVVAETWSYDVDTDTWTQMQPEVSPPARTWHGMAYDAGADLVIVYGGFDAFDEYLGDTWTYDLDTDTWTEIPTKTDPGPRAYFDMAYDPPSGTTILFGGATGPWGAERTHADTWAFDAERGRWTELAPDSAPSPRGWHAMAYDATGEVIVLFGGGPSRNEYTAETWIYDPRADTWSQVG